MNNTANKWWKIKYKGYFTSLNVIYWKNYNEKRRESVDYMLRPKMSTWIADFARNLCPFWEAWYSSEYQRAAGQPEADADESVCVSPYV
jgi:hypothetical protein